MAVERFCNPRRLDRFDGYSGRQAAQRLQKMNCRIRRVAAQRRDVCSESFNAPTNMIGRVIWRTPETRPRGGTANGKAASAAGGMELGASRQCSAALSAVDRSVYWMRDRKAKLIFLLLEIIREWLASTSCSQHDHCAVVRYRITLDCHSTRTTLLVIRIIRV